MDRRIDGNEWHRNLWKAVSSPMANVVAMLVLVGVSTWVVVSTEVDLPRHNPYPLAYVGGHK